MFKFGESERVITMNERGQRHGGEKREKIKVKENQSKFRTLCLALSPGGGLYISLRVWEMSCRPKKLS